MSDTTTPPSSDELERDLHVPQGPPGTRQQYLREETAAAAGFGPDTLRRWDDAHRDARMADALTRLASAAPTLRQAPQMLLETAQASIRMGQVDQAVADLSDTETFLRMRQQLDVLRSMPASAQQAQFDRLPRGVQQVYRRQGYRPPGEAAPEVQAAGLNPLDAVGFVADKISDLGRYTGVTQLGGGVLHGLERSANALSSVQRTVSFVAHENNGADSGGFLGIPDAAVDAYNLVKNPGHTLRVYSRAWDGESLFLPQVAEEVAATFDDEENYELAARIAAGEDFSSIIESYQVDEGSPEYATLYQQLLDFTAHPKVAAAVERLSGAKISQGRTLARHLGLAPGSNPFTVVSGAGDLAFTWTVDPTLVAGKAYQSVAFSRHGLTMLRAADRGAVLARVDSFFGPGLLARAAERTVTDVADPGYWRALGAARLSQEERAGVAIADHFAASVDDPGALDRLRQGLPGTTHLMPTLARWQAEHGLSTVEDFHQLVRNEVGLSALLEGRAATFHRGYTTLPRLTPLGTRRIRAKVAFEEAIDYTASAPLRLREGLYAEDLARTFDDPLGHALTPAQRTVDLLITSTKADAMAELLRRPTRLVPKRDALVFGDPTSTEIFSQLLDFGVYGEQRRALLGRFVRAQTEGEKRAVTSAALETLFDNADMLHNPVHKPFVDAWLRHSREAYALDGLDEIRTGTGVIRAGLWPQADASGAMGLPNFKAILAETRRSNLTRFLTGVTQSSGITRFMNYWRPSVILKPAFALRAGGEEAFNQFVRFGPGHLINQWFVVPAAARRGRPGIEGAGFIARRLDRTAKRIARRIPGWADDASEELTAAAALATRVGEPVRKAAGTLASVEDVRAYRALMAEPWAQRMFKEVGGADVGILAAANPLPDSDGLLRFQLGSFDDPKVLELRPVGSQYDVYLDTDDLRVPMLGNAYSRLQSDEVFRLMARTQSLFVDVDQAGRIAERMTGIAGDAHAVVGRVRARLAALPWASRRRLFDYLEAQDPAAAREALAAAVAAAPADTKATIGRWAKLADRNDQYALMVDVDDVAASLPAGEWGELIAGATAGDAETAQLLMTRAAAEHMKSPGMRADVLRMDRAGPLVGVVDDDVLDLAADPAVREAVRALRGSDELDQTAMARHLGSLQPIARRLTPDLDRVLANQGGRWRLAADPTVVEAQLEELLAAIEHTWEGKSLGQAIDEWAPLQRHAMEQLTLNPEGGPIHAVVKPMGDGRFDFHAHLVNRDLRLPARVVGPKVTKVDDLSLTARAVRWGFDALGRQVSAIARRPLWNKLWGDAYRENMAVLAPVLRNPQMRDFVARLADPDEVYDVLREAVAKLPEDQAWKGLDAFSDVGLLQALDGHGWTNHLSADPKAVAKVRAFYANEVFVQERVSHVASIRATQASIPYIDDHRVRSQFQEYAGNIQPFWFAEEQFYKRWARTFRHSPEALRRAQLAHHGMFAVGWLDTNEHGDEVFVYPASAWTVHAIAKVADLLPGDANYSIPIEVAMTGQLQYAAPGLDSLGRMPSVGPLVAMPINLLARINPDLAAPLERRLLDDRGVGRSLPEMVVPTTVMRFWKAFAAKPEDLAAATLGAMQMYEASHPDEVPGPDATDEEVDAYLERINNHARIVGLTRAIIGATGPAAPAPDFDPAHLDQEYVSLLRSGIPIEEATERYLKAHPDASAYTVFASEVPSYAPVGSAAATFHALTDHDEFFERYTGSSAWLLPETESGDLFDQQAWSAQFAYEVRRRKGATEFYRDIKWQEAAPIYFDSRDAYEAAKADSATPQARAALTAQWNVWKDEYFATHRIFAEDLQSRQGAQRRARVLEEIDTMLADPDAPDVPQKAALTQMVQGYRALTKMLTETKADPLLANTERGRELRLDARVRFAQWAEATAVAHPTALAFYERILLPELDLPEEE